MVSNLLLILISFLTYLPALSFFFVGDDYGYLTVDKITTPLFVQPTLYHYVPIPWVILLIVKYFFKTNPFPYHFLVVIIHLINVLLVKKFAKYFFNNEDKWPFICALLFSLYFANYEVVFWITGFFIAISLTFYLLAFNFFARFLHDKKNKNYWLFIIFYLCSILSHEFGVSLLIFCFVYLLLKKGVKKLKEGVGYFLIPVIIFGLVSFIKIIGLTVSPFASPVNLTRWIISVLSFLDYTVYPNPFFWEVIYQINKLSVLTIISLGLILFGMRKIKGVNLQIVVIIMISGLFSVTSWPQMRYLYFLAFSSSLFWTYLLRRINNKLIITLMIVFLITPQWLFIQARAKEWMKASTIAKNVVQSLSSENVCFLAKNKNYPAALGNNRWKAYIIFHPQPLIKFFFNKECFFN